MARAAIDRFEEKYIKTPGGCWRWIAAGVPHGYGVFYFDGRQGYAHRFSYEYHVGPIPEGFWVDHLCRNRGCVNPRHLQAVTPRVNSLRGMGWAAVHAARRKCPSGHDYDEANTYVRTDGSRVCRRCGAHRAKAKRSQAKGAA